MRKRSQGIISLYDTPYEYCANCMMCVITNFWLSRNVKKTFRRQRRKRERERERERGRKSSKKKKNQISVEYTYSKFEILVGR